MQHHFFLFPIQNSFWSSSPPSWWCPWRSCWYRQNRDNKRFGQSCGKTVCGVQLLWWLGLYCTGQVFQGDYHKLFKPLKVLEICQVLVTSSGFESLLTVIYKIKCWIKSLMVACQAQTYDIVILELSFNMYCYARKAISYYLLFRKNFSNLFDSLKFITKLLKGNDIDSDSRAE